MAATIGITGNVRDRFVQAVVLLHILDPVRGEPTVYGLDQDAHEIDSPRERLLRRKFLDSFALVCSTKRNGDSVSATCIEEGRPQGTVIRIASNSGVPEATLVQVRELGEILSDIGSRVREPSSGEEEILLRVIRLDIIKIRQYLKDLRATKGIFDEPVAAIESRARIALSHIAPSPLQQFFEWFRHVFTIRDLPTDPEPEVLVDHIKWAQKAKRFHIDFLKAAFSHASQLLPRWVLTIFKLGRYGVASRALVQFALELPALVSPMNIEPVIAPPRIQFVVAAEDTPLTCVLKRVIGNRVDEFIPRLARIWNTTDAEGHFRSACSLHLVAHAEMQLVNFYDHNPHLKPTFRFIGVSKKACYLCHLFLTNHPDLFCVSSCHQKIYPSWIPPPTTTSQVYKRYKTMTKELSKVMEAIAKQDLDSRLGILRRPVPADSTAGVSLSGLTGLSRMGLSTQSLVGSEVNSVANEDVLMAIDPQPSSHAIEVVPLTPTDVQFSPFTHEGVLHEPANPFSELDNLGAATVFHFRRADDASKQDIICMNDIINPSTGYPSWARLVEILKNDDVSGLAFNEGNEFLMVNDQIRVGSGRQLRACLQYLRNAGILNVEIFVHSTEKLPIQYF